MTSPFSNLVLGVGRILFASGSGPGAGRHLLLDCDPELAELDGIERDIQTLFSRIRTGGIRVAIVMVDWADEGEGWDLVELSCVDATDEDIEAERVGEFRRTRDRAQELVLAFAHLLDRVNARIWHAEDQFYLLGSARTGFTEAMYRLSSWPLQSLDQVPHGRHVRCRDVGLVELARACAHLGLVVDPELLTGRV